MYSGFEPLPPDFVQEEGERQGNRNTDERSEQVDSERIPHHWPELEIAKHDFEIVEAVPGAGEDAFDAADRAVVLEGPQQPEKWDKIED